MVMIIICDRWIDEVQGRRCVLEQGHQGKCSHVYERRDQIKDGWPEPQDPRWDELR